MHQLKQQKFELVVLGSGAGASFVYDGLISSSFMLLYNDEPFCLVDLGLGVGRKVIEAFGSFPKNTVITHNHSDHAGDLAVVLRVELARGNQCRVIAQTEVVKRLKTHRVAEHLEQMSADDLAEWVEVDTDKLAEIGHGLRIQFYPGVHSETSYGFILFDAENRPVLSYTADSKFSGPLYSELNRAPVFILDARPKTNPWHASFSEVKSLLREGTYILGHGVSEQVARGPYAHLPLLVDMQRVKF